MAMPKYQITISCEKGKLAKTLRELADTIADERYIIGTIREKKYSIEIKEIKDEKRKNQ